MKIDGHHYIQLQKEVTKMWSNSLTEGPTLIRMWPNCSLKEGQILIRNMKVDQLHYMRLLRMATKMWCNSSLSEGQILIRKINNILHYIVLQKMTTKVWWSNSLTEGQTLIWQTMTEILHIPLLGRVASQIQSKS